MTQTRDNQVTLVLNKDDQHHLNLVQNIGCSPTTCSDSRTVVLITRFNSSHSLFALVNRMGIKNRSRMDIYFDILSAARQPVRKTHIMYKSNLSYKQLDMYLNTLLDRNLIEEGVEEGARVYNVTSRGLNFIELFENISAYLTPSELNPPSELVSEGNGYEVIEKEPFVY